MPITVQYELDGQETILQPFMALSANDYIADVLLRLGDTMMRELGHLVCPDHHHSPVVTIVAAGQGQSGFRIQGCCAKLTGLTRQAIHDLLNTVKPQDEHHCWLTLTISKTNMTLLIDGRAIGYRWVIGRWDPDNEIRPEIDLTAQDAFEKGISRQHMALMWQVGAFQVMDLDSANRSHLNGNCLFPYKSYPLHHGDRLRLGRLELDLHIL